MNTEQVLLKKNIFANYIGQIYVMATSILIMPFYLQYMGPESYGLVGFFTLMQVWLNILDAGFSPTLGRQVAEARGNSKKFKIFFKLLRSLEMIFLLLSIIIIVVIFSTSEWISKEWIQSNNLTEDTIQYCIIVMGIILSIRWFSTIYKSGINGFEDQVWLNKINIFIISIKYFGALFILIFISQDIELFFNYQLAIGIIEVIILNSRMYNLLPVSAIKGYLFSIKIDIYTIRSILPFSMSIASTTLIWTLLMQFDKLFLSSILPLDKFGYFSIINLVASSLISISTPIFLAILPRMTMLLGNGEKEEMLVIYRKMTQMVTWIVLSSSSVIYIYSEEILYILIGDIEASIWGKDILRLYILGYAFFILGSFQYYLQNSFGDLKYYLRGACLLVLFQLPIMYYALEKYEAIGSGIIWLTFNFLWFLFFTGIVHRKFLPNFHFKWLLNNIIPIMLIILVLSFFVNNLIYFEIDSIPNRWLLMLKIILVGFFFLIISSLSVDIFRDKIKTIYKNKIRT